MCLSMLMISLLLLSVPGNFSSNLTCISMPSLDHITNTLYFICTCPEEIMTGHISLARFVHNLPQQVAHRILVMDFRNCRSLEIMMDQTEIMWLNSQHFRPQIQIQEINVENCNQVTNSIKQTSNMIISVLIKPIANY